MIHVRLLVEATRIILNLLSLCLSFLVYTVMITVGVGGLIGIIVGGFVIPTVLCLSFLICELPCFK